MKTNKKLVSSDERINNSSVVIGASILELLKNKERVLIFDIYPYLKKRDNVFNYENTIGAIIFLYMNNIIDFEAPYIYNLAYITKRK